MGLLDRFFFGTLPDIFPINDTNKDGNMRGEFERFLLAIQNEAEAHCVDIENLPNLVDPLTTSDKFLDYIAAAAGYPPYTFDKREWFRKILDNIIAINQYKGTKEGFRRWFALWGIDVTIITSTFPVLRYNSGINYNDVDLYYKGGCIRCIKWEINISDPLDNLPILSLQPYTISTSLALQAIFRYLIPINCVLSAFHYNGTEVNIDLGANNNLIMIYGSSDQKILTTHLDEPIVNEDGNHLTAI